MARDLIHAVTGAYGYSGKYITRKLIERGRKVVTLTNSISRENEFTGLVDAFPFHFDEPERLMESLQGVEVLYNTYWVRFNHPLFKHADAVRNTLTLFDAAKKAGVKRIVHISITNPSASSPLEYFRGKGVLEDALVNLGVSYAILRPAVIFGKEDILINNIAWSLRHLPVFGVFGDGRYRLQPIYVEDLADLAVKYGESRESVVVNALGPETFTYRGLVSTVGRLIGVSRPIISVRPWIGYWTGKLIGFLVGDVMITKEEVKGLMADLLYVDGAAPSGTTRLTEWVKERSDTLGLHYTSELARRKNRKSRYKSN